MVRYHFNVHDGSAIPDIEGTQLPTLGHAQREAVRLAGYLMMTQPKQFFTGTEWRVDVTNDHGDALFRVHFYAENVNA